MQPRGPARRWRWLLLLLLLLLLLAALSLPIAAVDRANNDDDDDDDDADGGGGGGGGEDDDGVNQQQQQQQQRRKQDGPAMMGTAKQPGLVDPVEKPPAAAWEGAPLDGADYVSAYVHNWPNSVAMQQLDSLLASLAVRHAPEAADRELGQDE
jgi:hypothetical protein